MEHRRPIDFDDVPTVLATFDEVRFDRENHCYRFPEGEPAPDRSGKRVRRRR